MKARSVYQVRRVLGVGLAIAGGMVAAVPRSVEAADTYLAVGRTVRTWDTFSHLNNPAWQTFAKNGAWPIGAARRADGRVVVVLPEGTSSPGPQERVLYVFDIDLTTDPPWRIAEGPVFLPYLKPSVTGGPDIVLPGPIAEYHDDRYALLGYWQETVRPPAGDAYLVHHSYVLTVRKDGGDMRILVELPRPPFGLANYGLQEMAFLPSDGSDPDCFVFSALYPKGSFYVFSATGSLLRWIDPKSLFLASEAGQCSYHAALEATGDRDLLAISSDEGATDCPDPQREVVVRFDRYGTWKGAWSLGGSLPWEPWLPSGFNAMAQLSSGHIYVASLMAAYLLPPGPDYGDRNGRTFRHFIVEPPWEAYQPLLVTSPDELRFDDVVVGVPVTKEITVANGGAAELVVQPIELEITDTGFRLDGPTEIRLPPSFGVAGGSGTEKVRVTFTPTLPGSYRAVLKLTSNDPSNLLREIPVRAQAVPVGYADVPLFELSEVMPPPAVPGGIALSGTGDALFLAFREPTAAGEWQTRLFRAPVGRSSDGRVLIGRDAIAEIGVLPGTAIGGLTQGPDDTLWLVPANPGDTRLFQFRPSAGLSAWSWPVAGGKAPRLVSVVPGSESLLVVAHDDTRLHLVGLNRSGGEFWEPSYRGALPDETPRPAAAMAFWEQGGFLYSLIRIGTELWLSRTPPGILGSDLGTSARLIGPEPVGNVFGARTVASRDVPRSETSGLMASRPAFHASPTDIVQVQVAEGSGATHLTYDAGSGDVLYVDAEGGVRRLQAVAGFAEDRWLRLEAVREPLPLLRLFGTTGSRVRVRQAGALSSPMAWTDWTNVVLTTSPESVPIMGNVAGGARFYQAILDGP